MYVDLSKSAFDSKIVLGSRIFFEIMIFKMSVKMNYRMISKNHAADPEIGFLRKSILKPYSRDAESVRVNKEFFKILFAVPVIRCSNGFPHRSGCFKIKS